MKVYRIRDWDRHFENNRTRELKNLSWVPVPNKQDGDGYTEIMSHKNGAAHFGCWHAILQVASKCDPRGTLLRDGARAHDFTSLSRITRIPESILIEAVERLLTIGWVEIYDNPALGCDKTAEGCGLPEGNGMEQKEGKKIAVKAKPSQPALRIKLCTEEWIETLRPDCQKQGIDLDNELIKANRWIAGKPGRKLTQKFLINWLNRADKTITAKTPPPQQSVYALRERVKILEAEREHLRNSFQYAQNNEAKKKVNEITTSIRDAEKKILELTNP